MSKRQRTGSMISKKSTSKKARQPTPALQKAVKQVIVRQSEGKWIDRAFSGNMNAATVPTNNVCDPATNLCLNSMVQGDDSEQRNGVQIQMTSVQVEGTIRFLGKESTVMADQPSPPSGKSVFVHICLDKLNAKSTAALDGANVHANELGTVLGNGSLLRNPDFMTRFSILKSFKYDLEVRPFLKEVVAAASGGSFVADLYTWPEKIIHFSLYHKFKTPLRVRYSGNTGNKGDIIDNALHIVAGYGTESETDSAPVLSYNSRVRFVDF